MDTGIGWLEFWPSSTLLTLHQQSYSGLPWQLIYFNKEITGPSVSSIDHKHTQKTIKRRGPFTLMYMSNEGTFLILMVYPLALVILSTSFTAIQMMIISALTATATIWNYYCYFCQHSRRKHSLSPVPPCLEVIINSAVISAWGTTSEPVFLSESLEPHWAQANSI